jgi:hypothetical protein
MDGVGQTGASSSAAAAGSSRVGATNIGRLRPHAARGDGATASHLRVFVAVVGVMGCLLLAAPLAMSAVHQVQFRNAIISRNFRGLQVKTTVICFLQKKIEAGHP